MPNRTFQRLMRTIALAILLFATAVCAQSETQDKLLNALAERIENPILVGRSKFKVAFWDIYNIALYAGTKPFDERRPYALEIEYLRNFSGEAMSKKSIELILAQGFDEEERLEDWQQQMTEVFPDIQKGSVLTGIYTEEGPSHFYGDGDYLGEISDPEFGKYFFGIWLAADTSEPEMREELIGSEAE